MIDFRWQWDRFKYKQCLPLLRLIPYKWRMWIVIFAFADTSKKHPTKHPDQTGYSDVIKAME